MKELIKKSGEKISAFQKKSVSLHSENEDAHLNDAVNYRGAEAAATAHRQERGKDHQERYGTARHRGA